MSCGCQTTSSNCVREPFNANFVRPLTHIRGVDANGCVSYAPATSFAFNVQDTNTLDLTLAAGVISGNVRISGAAGNQVQALADGLFVPAGAGLQILDTNTVDLTLAGNVLSAQARISTNAGNVLQALANGLFVPAGAGLQIVDTNTIDLTLLGGVLTAQAIISPNAGNALQALPNGLFVPASTSISIQDTPSVDLTLVGGVLSANVIISTNAGNQLQLLPNGLYVAPSAFSLNVIDTNTVDLSLAGNNLTANVIISPNAGNALQALSNGLFVPSTASLSVQDTNSVDLTLTGGVLSASVIISPNAGNQLQLLPNGLYVAPSTFSLTVTDTNTVDLTLVGSNLTADVIVSPNVGNALQVLPNGLYVGPGAYSLSDCAGNPLPIGTQVLTCPTGVLLLNINDQLIASNPPGTALRTLSSKNCPEPANNDYIIIADNAGNVRYTRMSEAVSYGLTAGSPIVFPNIPLVTLQPPNTTTGTIDSAAFTNPRNCGAAYPKGTMTASLQHSFNQNNSTSTAFAEISFLRSLISRIDNYNTPGVTNTPLTGHGWRNQSIFAVGPSTERVVDLGLGIAPGSTTTYSRSLSVTGATNFYYVTVENWSATFNITTL